MSTLLRPKSFGILWLSAAYLLSSAGNVLNAAPQGTSFTYQGLLAANGMNVTVATDLRFTLWDAESGGATVGTQVLQTVTPEDGVFSVDLDFGADPFETNEARWLEIEASPAGAGMYESLGRTALRATTYSLSTRGISVDDQGQVGIRTTSPTSDLQVGSFSDGADSRITVATQGRGVLRASLALVHGLPDNGFRIESDERGVANGLHFIDMTGTDETVMFLRNDFGYVGIGTTDPNSRLHVNEPGLAYGSAFIPNTKLGISAADAVLDLVSDEGGAIGSTLSWKQVDSASVTLDDHWSLSVPTSGGFDLRYGANPSALGNPVVTNWLPGGSMGVGDLSHEARFNVSFHTDDVNIGIDVEGNAANTNTVGISSSVAAGRAIYGETSGASGTNFGVFGQVNALNTTGWGVFSNGRLGAAGTKSFCIDHPLDPANWYLLHYSTESPEPLNTYSGNAVFDDNGFAVVQLPEYFASLNKDIRYTLTPVGAPMPNLHVAQKVQNNAFIIAGGAPRMEVSWQITAKRNDAFVRTMGAPIEVQKSPEQRGRYLMPELHGQTQDAAINKRPGRSN